MRKVVTANWIWRCWKVASYYTWYLGLKGYYLMQLVVAKKSCNVFIAFTDDSAVTAAEKKTRLANWKTKNGTTQVAFSKSLTAPDMATSLLSVLALVKKSSSVSFSCKKNTFIWRREQIPRFWVCASRQQWIAFHIKKSRFRFSTPIGLQGEERQGNNDSFAYLLYFIRNGKDQHGELKQPRRQWMTVWNCNQFGGRHGKLYTQSYVRFKWRNFVRDGIGVFPLIQSRPINTGASSASESKQHSKETAENPVLDEK